MLWDVGSNYEYDAEGRVKHSYSTGQWQYPMYNALGQRVQDYQGTDPMTLTYPRDIFGQRTGTFAQWPSQNWTGWNVYWASVAGQRLNMGGADAYIDHLDVVGSTTMETDPAGGVQWKIAYYPWGQILGQGGIRQSVVWAGLDWQVNDPSYPSATREYNDGLGRWLTPDPGGVKVVKLDDPQTWNMYAYVGNNPTSRNDPSGLCFDPVTFWACAAAVIGAEAYGFHLANAYYARKVFIGEEEALSADEAMWNKIIPKYGLDSWAILKYDINDLAVRLPIEKAKLLATGTRLAKDLNDISGPVQKEGGGSEPATGPGPGESVTNATKAVANGGVKAVEHEAETLGQPDAAHSKPAKPAPSEARPTPSTQKPCGAFQKTGGCSGPAANLTSGWTGGP